MFKTTLIIGLSGYAATSGDQEPLAWSPTIDESKLATPRKSAYKE
jgi:hypothetical protein